MTTVSHGKPYAGNPHVRFEEGDSASAEPRRKSLLHNKGYVYILTNPALREVEVTIEGKKRKVEPVKIGMTNNIARRLGVLNTSTPENFVDRLIAELSSERDALVLENMVHEKLEPYRIYTADGHSTEFFNCSVELAKETVRRLAKKLHFELVDFKRLHCKGRVASTIERELSSRVEKRKDSDSTWMTKTQLAKLIARRGGNEGAFGGILQYLSRMRPCKQTSKWREPLEQAGIKFDGNDFVSDWHSAKIEG